MNLGSIPAVNHATDATIGGIQKNIRPELLTYTRNVVQHVHSAYLPIWVKLLGSLEDRCTKDRCFRPVVSTNAVVRNDEVRRLMGQPKLTAIVQSHRLTLFGHIACMVDNADTKRILSTLPPEDWRRPRGRPRITWRSTIQQDS